MKTFFLARLVPAVRRERKPGTRPRPRTLRVEQMEARTLMAADIDANLSIILERRFESDWFQRLSPITSDVVGEATNTSKERIHWKGRMVDTVPHEWIVQFDVDQGIRNANQAAIFLSTQSDKVEVVGGLGSAGQVLVRTPHLSSDSAIQLLAQLPDVEFFEPNMLSEAQRIPNDSRFPELRGLRNSLDQDIDADQAWDITTGKKNVVIGVIDSGVDYRHPDLAANIWTNPGEIAGDRIDNDGNGFVDDIHGFDFVNWDSDPMDRHGHGTHVAGTIAAVGNNGRGVTGVAWNASIMAIQILNENGFGTSYSNIVSAINYVTMMRVDYGVNVRVTNNSWGGGGYSQALRDAIVRSGEADILFVAAAGNSNNNNDALPFFPAGYDAPNIISVAALTSSGQYATFSSYGATSVDIAAPGVNVLSTLPGNRYGYNDGTSMAAPHVSGTIALVVSVNPELGSAALKQIVLCSAEPLADRSKPTLTSGRVNAHNAVVRARTTVGEADRFGVWRPQGGLFYADTHVPGYNGEKPIQFGLPGDIAIAGDWDGDGRDTVGVYRPNGGLFFLDVNRPGYSGEGAFQFGLPGDLPVAGDWNGDGIDDVGVFRPSSGQFFLDAGPRGYNGEIPFRFGLDGDLPIAGERSAVHLGRRGARL
jgi:subtilisin family serine protease